jgi:hypothetical protein
MRLEMKKGPVFYGVGLSQRKHIAKITGMGLVSVVEEATSFVLGTHPLDPSLDGMRTGSKAGFDLTLSSGKHGALEPSLSEPPEFTEKSFDSVVDALSSGPLHFGVFMNAIGSRDGCDVVIDLDELRQTEKLVRNDDGKYALV